MEESKIKTAVAQELSKKIDELASQNIKSFILYGSVATQTANKNSDIDIMLLLDYSDMNLLQKVKTLCAELQESSNQQIALSFNTVSNYLSQMMQGHQMYLNMCIHGICLKKSLVFEGIKKIIENSQMPSHQEIISHRKEFIQAQTKLFLGRSMTDFVANIDAIVRRYLHFKEFESSSVDSWKSYEGLVDHKDFQALIEKHLTEFAPELNKFYKYKKAFSPIFPPNSERISSLDLAVLVNCIIYIQNNTV